MNNTIDPTLSHGLEYNSSKEIMVIPEYGRNVQNLIHHARSIKDDEFRQAFAEEIIALMYRMSPNSQNTKDYMEKLWRHLFMIADYDIKVVPPSGVIPTPESNRLTPERVPYPSKTKKFRHYGNRVQMMVDKALAFEDKDQKEGYAMIIAQYMKLAYKTWNREQHVSDDVIKRDLLRMSDNQLVLPEEAKIEDLLSITKQKFANTTNVNMMPSRKSKNRSKGRSGDTSKKKGKRKRISRR